MDKYQQVWTSLADEEYRREYSADVGTGLAFQIKLLREKNGWTQEKLANLTGKQQETISQWEHPDYGSYTIKSLNSLAAAFDVALLVKFVPFSELVKWNASLTPERLAPPSFIEEQNAPIEKLDRTPSKDVRFVTAALSEGLVSSWLALGSNVQYGLVSQQYSLACPQFETILEGYAKALNAVDAPTANAANNTASRQEKGLPLAA